MEIKTLPFFGENGITSTSANHVANLAKEFVRSCQEKLAAVTFYDEDISLIGQKEKTRIHSGVNAATLNNLPIVIKTVSDAHSLIAFLREAIKEKERKTKEAQAWEDENELKALRDEEAMLFSTKVSKPAYPTEESVKQTWSIGEQEKYLSLEAEAAALGKVIHEDAPMSNARIDLMRKIENPSSVMLKGQDTIVHTYTPSVTLEQVDEVYTDLQKHYREVQAELNGMKKRIEDYISDRKMEIDAAYNSAVREHEMLQRQHDQKVRLYEDERDYKRNEMMRQIRDLKIVIPNRLRFVYDILTK